MKSYIKKKVWRKENTSAIFLAFPCFPCLF